MRLAHAAVCVQMPCCWNWPCYWTWSILLEFCSIAIPEPCVEVQIQQVVPDSMLLQLLVAWLSPGSKALSLAGAHTLDIKSVRPWKGEAPPEEPECCRAALGLDPLGCPLAVPGSKPSSAVLKAGKDHAPLKVCPPGMLTGEPGYPCMAKRLSRLPAAPLLGVLAIALGALLAALQVERALPTMWLAAHSLTCVVCSILRMCTQPYGQHWMPLPARLPRWRDPRASSRLRWPPWWSVCDSCALCAPITLPRRMMSSSQPSGGPPKLLNRSLGQ